MRPHSNLGNDAVYHLDLFLEKDTATAIQAVFNNGSFEDDGFMFIPPVRSDFDFIYKIESFTKVDQRADAFECLKS